MPVVKHSKVNYEDNESLSRGAVVSYFTPIQKDILFYMDVDTTIPGNSKLELGDSPRWSLDITNKHPSAKDAVLCHFEAVVNSINPGIVRCYYIVPPKLQHLYNSEVIKTPQPDYDDLTGEVKDYFQIERTVMRLRTSAAEVPELYSKDVQYPSAEFVMAEEKRFENREFDNLFVRERHVYKTLPGPILSNSLSPQSFSKEDSFLDGDGKVVLKTGYVYTRETRAQVVPYMPKQLYPEGGLYTTGFEKTDIPAVELYVVTLPYQVNLRNRIRSESLRKDVAKCDPPEAYITHTETETKDTEENFQPVNAHLKTPSEVELENASYLEDADEFSIQTGKDEYENRSSISERVTKTKKLETTVLHGRTTSQFSGNVLTTMRRLVKMDGSENLESIIAGYKENYFIEARAVNGCYVELELVQKDTAGGSVRYFEIQNQSFPQIVRGVNFITQDDGRTGSFVELGKPQTKSAFLIGDSAFSGPCKVDVEERWAPLDKPCPFSDDELKVIHMLTEDIVVDFLEYSFRANNVLHPSLTFQSGFSVEGNATFPSTNVVMWQPIITLSTTRFAGGRLYQKRTIQPPKKS